MTTGLLGWLATAVFAASYLFRQAAMLRRIQAAAACLWIVYGVAIGAVPVVVANLIVAAAAIYSSFRPPSTAGRTNTVGINQQAEQEPQPERMN